MPRIAMKLLTIIAILFWTMAPYRGIAAGPRPGVQPLTAQGQMQISAEDRCPVCAMKVRRHAKFASAIQLHDGTTYYFCGTGCMIRSWRHPEVFLNVPPSSLFRPLTQDYFSGKPLDARKAWWVAGSDIIGPMGPALVPLGKESDISVFRKRHGAKTIFRLHEMTDSKWLQITGKKARP